MQKPEIAILGPFTSAPVLCTAPLDFRGPGPGFAIQPPWNVTALLTAAAESHIKSVTRCTRMEMAAAVFTSNLLSRTRTHARTGAQGPGRTLLLHRFREGSTAKTDLRAFPDRRWDEGLASHLGEGMN